MIIETPSEPTPRRAGQQGLAAAPGRRLAALDLGTNNCRLLIAEPVGAADTAPGPPAHGESFHVLDSFSRIVRLGEGLAATGRLADAAMDRTIAALRVCRQLVERHRVVKARFVATEACRQAGNGAAFLARVRKATGIELEVLGQEEEARLAMLGCLPLIDGDAAQVLVLDIGGGSTEIMWLDRRERASAAPPGVALSLPVGVVTLAERFGSDPGPEDYAAMVRHVTGLLDADGRARTLAGMSDFGQLQMLGTSGTVTTLAALHLGLRRYDRRKVDGIAVPFAAIAAVGREFRGQTNATRAANPCIGVGRADLVVPGCAILEAVHALWPVTGLRVADRGLREGILSELTGRRLQSALIQPALRQEPAA